MISLQLFGGVSLASETGPLTGPATQRRRLALLAVLAAAPRATLSRDRLVAFFWPELDRERARHFLADSVFAIRKSLGKDSILSVGDDLVLSREALECDVWRFHQALECGDLESAAAAYRGPFLDGFFAADAPDFERWVEEERSRLARLYAEALQGLAEEMERRGDPARAAHWWRRLAVHDPYSSRVALRLMEALAAAGERAAALQHAQVHSALLREELELASDPEVEALAARLAAPPPPPPESGPPAARADPVPQAAEPRPATSPSASPVAPRPRPRRRPGLALLSLLLVCVLVASAAVWGRGRFAGGRAGTSRAAPGPGAATIAVLPFSFRGAPEHAYLGEGVVTLLSTSLNGAGELRSVDPFSVLSQAFADGAGAAPSPTEASALATSLGADHFVLGSVIESGGRLHVTATLYRTGTEPVAIQRVGTEGSDVFALVDELSRQFVVGRLRTPGERLSRLAALTTPSLPALKAYLQGERYLGAARYPEAADAFRQAVRLDPSFALAHFRLSAAAEWSFRFVEARQASREAVLRSEGLSERDRQIVAAWHHFVNGEAAEAERLYNAVLAEHPNDVEAWSGLGEVRLHYNPSLGRPADEAIPAFRRVLRLAPDYGEARFHMLEFAARSGDVAGFDSLLSQVSPQSLQLLSWQAARAFAWGGAEESGRYAVRLQDADEVTIGIATARAAVHFRDLDAAEALARLLAAPGRPDSWRAASHVLAAQIRLARGEWDAAQTALDSAARLEPGWTLETRALGALLPSAPSDPGRLRAIRAELERWDPSRSTPTAVFFFAAHGDVHPPLRHYLLAMLSARLGEDEALERHLRDLRSSGQTREGRQLVQMLVRSVDAHRAARRGDFAQALRLLEAGQFSPPLERIALSPFFARSPDRFLRAEALVALGRREEALRWLASLSDGTDLLYWPAAHEGQARLLAALGRPREARSHDAQLRSIRTRGSPGRSSDGT